jgi:4-alpha-glucanotransferase
LLRKSFLGFSESKSFHAFCRENAWWLESYSDFMALRQVNGNRPWNKFDPRRKASPDVARYHRFLQFEFYRQWAQFRNYCHRQKLSVLGDLPFYVEYNSADVWSNPELFDLDRKGEMRSVGGVPPDYFSRDGQRWGSPTYRWDRIAQQKFKWWIDRFRFSFENVDLLRVDHFRGFEAFWSVPASHKTAKRGHWVKAPGTKLFGAVKRKLGDVPVVAENLGVISPEVEMLRTRFGFPGIAVLQFGFDSDNEHRPSNYTKHTVAFTGTHDNNTSKGWWEDLHRAARRTRGAAAKTIIASAKSYLRTDGREIHWACIQAVMASVADLAVFPMQDVLGFGSEARMNFPGRKKRNWAWRLGRKDLHASAIKHLRSLTEATGRE